MNTISKLMKLIVTMSIVVMVSGCSQRIGAFTMASTKIVKVNAEEMGDRVEGKHMVFFGTASLEEAVDRAIQSAPGADALIDVTIWYTTNFITTGFKIQGTPVSTKNFSQNKIEDLFVTTGNINELYQSDKIKKIEE